MKKIIVRKKLLALLISGNIMLAGCSISSGVTSKKEQELSDSSYTQSSIDENTNILESKYEDKSTIDSSLTKKNNNNQISTESKDELKELVESSIEEENHEISEETSMEEMSESESCIDEETEEEYSEISEETSMEEMSESESNIDEETEEEYSEISEETSVEEMNESESSIEEKTEENSYADDCDILVSESDVYNNEIYTDDNIYIRAKTIVNVRSEANTESNILTRLSKGNILKKVGYVDNWYIVEYDGKNAYVSADYTEEIEESKINADLNESNICYFPYGTTLYSDKEFTNKIMDIPSLESGQIYYQEGNAYFVDTAGSNGYVDISSATIIPQPVVIVDKSEQTLRLYKNNQKQMEFSVVTGNENSNFYHPSDEGLFSIYSKSYNAELVGDTWDVVVNVFMGYNGGEGIHDATWRSYFGGDIYTYDGSHGCVNCPYNEVMDLANEVEVGNKVLVKR